MIRMMLTFEVTAGYYRLHGLLDLVKPLTLSKYASCETRIMQVRQHVGSFFDQ